MDLPVAFKERMKEMLKDEYEDYLRSYDAPKIGGLRVNTLKGSVDKFRENSGFSLEPVPWVKEGFYYRAEERPGKSIFHEAGAIYIQEPSAMAVAALADVRPGERVLDLCAAPGGKSTQIASALAGKGCLYSNEIHPARARILSQNIERMGVTNAIVLNETPDRLAKRFPEFFDCIVVDAPCSGEGMFRKEENAAVQWSPENVTMCAKRQQEILREAVKMLRFGGRLIYSTCTFAPAENEENVLFLLDEYPNLSILKGDHFYDGFGTGRPEFVNHRTEVLGSYRLWPHEIKGEGHFMCAFVKDKNTSPDEGSIRQRSFPEDEFPMNQRILSGEESAEKIKKGTGKKASAGNRGMSKSEKCLFEDFIQTTCKPEFADFVSRGMFALFGNLLYRLPEEVCLDGLKVERAGLCLGSFEKNRFEPSHALAMAMKETDACRVLDLNCEDAKRYFMGESFPFEEAGWTLVTANGYSCGFGKTSNGVCKNHYPKGLRKNL